MCTYCPTYLSRSIVLLLRAYEVLFEPASTRAWVPYIYVVTSGLVMVPFASSIFGSPPASFADHFHEQHAALPGVPLSWDCRHDFPGRLDDWKQASRERRLAEQDTSASSRWYANRWALD